MRFATKIIRSRTLWCQRCFRLPAIVVDGASYFGCLTLSV